MSQCAFPGKMFVHIIGRTFFVSPYIHKGIEEDWRLLNENIRRTREEKQISLEGVFPIKWN